MNLTNILGFPSSSREFVLPSSIFSQLINYWPMEEMFIPYGDGKSRKIGDPGRFGFYVLGDSSKESFAKLDTQKNEWYHSVLLEELKKIIILNYIEYLPFLRARFINNWNNLEFHSFAVLCNTYQKIHVLPHTENRTVLFTILLYIGDNKSDAIEGTTIYHPIDKNFKHSGNGFLERNNFKIAYQIPFQNNTCFSFLKTNRSFHGVEKSNISSFKSRRMINIHCRLTNKSICKIYNTKNPDIFRNDKKIEISFNKELDEYNKINQSLQGLPTKVEMMKIKKSFTNSYL